MYVDFARLEGREEGGLLGLNDVLNRWLGGSIMINRR